MSLKGIRVLLNEEKEELIEGKKRFFLHLTSIKSKNALLKWLLLVTTSEVEIYTNSKNSFAKSVKGYVNEDICAKDTPVSEFLNEEWVTCIVGDPIIIDLSFIGRYLNRAFFKTRNGDIISTYFDYDRATHIEPYKENN